MNSAWSFTFHFATPSPLKHLILGLLMLSFWASDAQELPKAKQGVLDLRTWQFQKNQPISLAGEWEFYWERILYPADFDSMKISPVYREFPKLWKGDVVNGDTVSSEGYATQRLQVVVNSVTPELAITIPHFYSSYLLFLNGEYIGSNGQVGASEHTSKPHWQYMTREFKVTSDTLEVVLQISNFEHSRGGSFYDIKLGEKVKMQTIEGRERAFDLIMSSSLFFIGLFFMVLFWFGRHEKQILYYSLFCLFYSYRSIGSGSYTLHSLYPELPWLLTLKAEYITMFMAGLFFSYYSYYLYKRETSRLFLLLVTIISGTFVLMTLFAPVKFFTTLVGPYSVTVLIGFVYMMYTYVMAVMNKREGSLMSLVSSFLLFLVMGAVILEHFGWLKNSMLFYFVGYQQFFFFQSIILFYRYNRKIEIAKEKAESAARSQSDFLSMISHEIRTPLNAVIGLTNYLIGDKPKKQHADDLKTLKFSAEHLHVLINDVLDYSKLDAGKIEFEEVDVNVVDMAKNITKGFDTRAKEKDIYLNFLYDEDIPNFIVCDGLRLSQILTNLIGNAIKFTDEGGVTLSMNIIMQTKKRVSIKFSVEDSGIGIPKDKLKTIFDSFSQASTSTTREYGGTGLGLSITKRILDMQNTKINVFSVDGQGSRFYFTQTFAISNNQEKVTEKTLETHNQLEGKSILLVEDNPVNVMVAKKFLSRWDIKVDVAENGREALEKTAIETYDLVLMDLQMPEMDGYTASEELRKRGFKTPILALTASVMLDVGDRVFKSGMNDFITKPFDPDDLFNKIRLHIEKQEASEKEIN
ncbi:Signal transduction histidine kinase [Reichenbachiella faecimaris]|uniref:histidine kinase n=1 Tax=Reichenbachiella faecimaris TaxID=692418 RepID=A0A1W2G6F8_REIFA|nr:response regulator [Reichenbachiella faecimaris]SMD32260.1 Signal transduction histidine kinase [Reichenbachiella faecimaris]